MNRGDLLIEADELASVINDPGLRLFDATVVFREGPSGHEQYREAHIPGAAFMDHSVISDSTSDLMFTLPDEAELKRGVESLGISNDNTVVFYSTDELCWATRAWWVLRYAGHTNIRVLNGGFGAWKGELENGDQIYPAGSFTPSIRPSLFADKNEVLETLKDGSACTVFTLPHALYTGELEMYEGKGHITGSLSHPMSELMNGQYMKSSEALARSFRDRLPDKRMITYCGGGVSATLNAAAALVAGIDDVAVYDGSLSEWIKDDLSTTRGKAPGVLE